MAHLNKSGATEIRHFIHYIDDNFVKYPIHNLILKYILFNITTVNTHILTMNRIFFFIVIPLHCGCKCHNCELNIIDLIH